MKALIGSVLAVLMVLVAGAAVAGPCDQAGRGTYLSNVCWLIEEFTAKAVTEYKIVAADEAECTVTLDRQVFVWSLFRKQGNVIHFNRASHRTLEEDRWSSFWTLRGEGVNGDGFDSVTLGGLKIDWRRIDDAFENLYIKYCRGVESEF